MKKQLALFFVISLFYACDIDSKKLQLVNHSNEIYFYQLKVDTLLENKAYLYKLLPYDTVYPIFVRGSKEAWNYKINNDSKDSTLHIFIFKVEKLSDCVIKNHDYRRLDLKIKNLDSLKWRVVITN